MVRDIKGKRPEYFEATIQLRNIFPEALNFVKEEIVRTGIHVAKEVKQKNGIDFFVSDNEVARAIGKKLQERYGGELLMTASLHTKKKGKDLYRTTVLFRGIPFRKGDIVEYGGEKYNVKLMGKDILLQHAKTGKKVHVRYKEMDRIKVSS